MATVQDQATGQLSALPFDNLIGGPLVAAIDASGKAAMSSYTFINSVGFDDKGKTRMVTFSYEKNGDTLSLTVPLLAILPIPFIRIESMNINFKANISADTSTNDTSSSSTQKSASMEASGRYWFVSAKMNASASSKKDSSSTRDSKYSVEYTMDVNVHAVQDEMPAGLAKVLNIMTDAIASTNESGGGSTPAKK